MADYVSALTGPEMDEALYDMASHTSEAWAVGTRNDEPVTSGDPTFNNSSKYWAGRSQTYNSNAQAAAARAEAAVPSGTAGAVFFDRAQSLTDAQKEQVKANIGAGGVCNQNLLVNPCFIGGLVVNQRGFTGSQTAVGYTVDMWSKGVLAGTVSITSSGITLTGDSNSGAVLQQLIPDTIFRRKLGQPFTVSYLTTSGLVRSVVITMPESVPSDDETIVHKYFDDGVINVTWVVASSAIRVRFISLTSGSLVLRQVKFEAGTNSTIKDDIPTTNAEEFRKCRFYFRRIQRTDSSNLAKQGIAQNATTATFLNITDGEPMFKTPTVTFSGSISTWPPTTSISALAIGSTVQGDYRLNATTSGLTAGNACALYMASGAYIDLNAQP